MKKQRLSHSAVRLYSECARKYRYHYLERLRSKTISGALLMGSAYDKGITSLLETKNLNKAIDEFDKAFTFSYINNKYTDIPKSELVVYAKRDFDRDLLLPQDIEQLEKFSSDINPLSVFSDILKQKEEKGFENLTSPNKQFYNYANWLCLRQKGHIMLKGWYDQILPKIKQVLSVQKQISLKNSTGDEIIGYIDLEVEWIDGKRYVLDNKTSYMEYEQDSVMTSQQLILYYHAEKIPMKLDGAGFIVSYKTINKNKIKICEKCKKDGSGQRHKTCDNLITSFTNEKGEKESGTEERCNGKWIETIRPEARIDVILSAIPEAAENLVLETFDEANENIKKEAFGPNLESCYKYNQPCQFFSRCWKGEDGDLIKLEDDKK